MQECKCVGVISQLIKNLPWKVHIKSDELKVSRSILVTLIMSRIK